MVETLDPAALDALTGELLRNGFEPTSPDRWVGPLPESLRLMTDAETIAINLYDGWPYRPPGVFVKGLPIGRHRNSAGHVCLWESGDPSLEWLTLAGIIDRIDLWAVEAQGDARADDPGLDPHLIFQGLSAGLATIDLSERTIAEPSIGDLTATETDGVLKIGEGDARGRWYVVNPAPQLPQKLADLDPYLTEEQSADLGEVTSHAGEPEAIKFLVFAWQTPVGPNLLILQVDKTPLGELDLRTYEAARTDLEVLLLRAGPDAAVLQQKTAVVFGVGAIGSHVANLIARSGLTLLAVVDAERLRPGDVVRHAAPNILVGSRKTSAITTTNIISAPWTDTRTLNNYYWDPASLATIVEFADVIIDATGLANFTAQLSLVCESKNKPLVSVSLYRRGFVGRVRYQAAEPQIAIVDRPAAARFPLIPAGDDEEGASWEAGCMAAVAEAPPTSVVGIAATATRVAIESLTSRSVEDRDVIEVYRPLDTAPFDSVGTTVIR